jgi:hypothetical protein
MKFLAPISYFEFVGLLLLNYVICVFGCSHVILLSNKKGTKK